MQERESHLPGEGSRLAELLSDKLQAAELCQSSFMGMITPPGFLLAIPFISTILDFTRQQFMVTATNKRLILIELAKPFLRCKEKESKIYDLADVKSVKVKKGMLSSTVLIKLADGTEYFFREVKSKEASAFSTVINTKKE